VPGRTPSDAVKAFLEPLKMALSCIARAQLTVSPTGYSNTDREHVWALNRAQGAVLAGSQLRLKASMRYRIVPTEPGSDEPWRVTTRGYLYTLENAQSEDEILAWHWHPTSSHTGPHAHVGSTQLGPQASLSARSHISTSRVAFEAVVQTALELGASPIRDDWESQLALTLGLFEVYRTWGTLPPEDPPPEGTHSGRHRR
jgi:hypothetical protein